MFARRNLWIVLAAIVAASACSDATGPEVQDVNGQWTGTLTHPSYDGGSLSMMLTDTNGSVEGSYRLILARRVGSRTSVEQSSGRVSGSSSNGRLTLLMERGRGLEWLLEGRLGGSTADGEWSTDRGVRGTFSIAR